MLSIQLLNNSIPRLQLQDSIAKAIQLVSDFKLTHLPVVANEIYLGLISEDDLLDAEDLKQTVETLQEFFIKVFVHEQDHFLNAVTCCNQYDTSVVPVINTKNELLGIITSNDLLRTLGNFAGTNEIGGIVVIEMDRSQFSISEISRIIESNDATIFHLNTITNPNSGRLTITLHINKKELSAIVASFERYNYEIIYYFDKEKFGAEIEVNYKHLMSYLDI